MAAPADISTLSYEEARNELVSVVSELEQGSPTLEQTLALWERGEALATRCEEWLLGAKERLNAARAGLDSASVVDGTEESKTAKSATASTA